MHAASFQTSACRISAFTIKWKEGTQKNYTYLKESVMPVPIKTPEHQPIDPRVQALVTEVIGRVADKWTMQILEVLTEAGEQRFTQIGRAVEGISQKMLTQTLRQMERDGLLIRTVHPVVPPRVEYRLTTLGLELSEAFCGVWLWAERHLTEIESARQSFDARR
jgi:DNA-binding HxlR family transcriptional regulator